MVLRMDQQGAILQHHQMPLHADYPTLPLDSDCADGCGPAHTPEQYDPHGTVDVLRRDTSLTHPLTSSYGFTTATHPSNVARFVPDRALGDTSSYQTTGTFSDSNSGSLSTSPSSAASSLAYSNYPGTHYTGVQQFPGAVQLGQGFVPSTFSGSRPPSSLLDNPSQSMLPPPQRSSLSAATHERDSLALHSVSTPYLARNTLPNLGYPTYNTAYPDTPRSVIQATATLNLSPESSPGYSHMTPSSHQGYGTTASECANFPWADIDCLVDMSCDGQLVVPKVHAKVEKGFFEASQDKLWTCYRRNYFSVNVSFELRGSSNQGRLTIKRNNGEEQVQAMGMRLSAAVDGADGKSIELVQHTPKRDNGPKMKIEICKVAPTVTAGRDLSHAFYQGSYHASNQMPGPYLPLQHSPEADAQAGAQQDANGGYSYTAPGQPSLLPGQGTSHLFERVQFKQATANNGKRRATQQFFHLIVELWADVRKDGAEKPVWVKVAQRVSARIVVRGRSPSHYSNDKAEPHHSSSARNSISGMSYTPNNATYGLANTGGFRHLTNAYGSAAVSSNGNGMNGTMSLRRPDFQYSEGSQSDSSGSSLEEGPMDATYQQDAVMSEAERIALHDHAGYQYYPSAIYEGVSQAAGLLPPLAKLEHARYADDGKNYAVKAEYNDAVAGPQYQVNNCGRFQGVDTSRGYYPELQARF